MTEEPTFEEFMNILTDTINNLGKVVEDIDRRLTQIEIVTGLDDEASTKLMEIVEQEDLFNITKH